jgi:hypothetical protein
LPKDTRFPEIWQLAGFHIQLILLASTSSQ